MSNEVSIAVTSVDFVKCYNEMVAMQNLCEIVSKIFNRNKTEVFKICMAAKSMGMDPFYALNKGLVVINDKVCMSAETMVVRIREFGHTIIKIKSDEKICTIKGVRADNGEEMTESFTIEEAAIAKLTSKDNWVKYPEAMLYSRTVSKLFRRLFPDLAFGTSYTPEEMESIRSEKVINTYYEEKKESINHEQYIHITTMLEELGDEYRLTVESYLEKQDYDKSENLFIKMPVKLYENIIKRIESKFNEVQDAKIYEEEKENDKEEAA